MFAPPENATGVCRECNVTPAEPWRSPADAWSVPVGVVLSLVIAISIGGNLLVCLAIYSDRRLRKLGNLFLASLALADLFVAALVETFALANDLMNRWIFGQQFCDIWIAFDVMCCTSSILNLCAISLDRFLHIKDPMRYGRWMTRRVVFGSVAAIWLLSGLVSFVPVTLGWHGRKAQDDLHCSMDLSPTYAVVSSCVSFYLPCCVMVALYGRLYSFATRQARAIRSAVPRGRTGSTASSASLGKNRSEHKAAITLGVIMGTFLVCWVPFFCINIAAAFCKTCVSEMTFKGLTWLGYLNSAFNPVIYSIFNLEFRRAFRRIFVSCFGGRRGGKDTDSWTKLTRRRSTPVLSATEMTSLRGEDHRDDDVPVPTPLPSLNIKLYD